MINGKSSKVSIPLNFRPSSDKLTNVNGIAQIIVYKDGIIKISGMSNTTNIVTLTYAYSL